MTALSRLIGVLAEGSDVARVGSAAFVGLAAALSHVTRREPHNPLPRTDHDLRLMLRARLANRQIIVLSNREPRIHELADDGEIVVRSPASGLVTALEPVVRACGGVWIAHGSGSADRITSDRGGRIVVEAGDGRYVLRRMWLTPKEERGYYHGFANEAVWPLCHTAFTSPVFRRYDWLEYERVNRRFADAVVAEVRSPDPIILVQDYHFALVPRMIREQCPDAVTVAFWHIPWPSPDQFAVCPVAPQILDGLLGSSIVGFQTPRHCRNFLDSVELALGPSGHRANNAVVHRGTSVQVRAYPISVEWPNPWTTRAPSVEECRRSVRAEFGLEPGTQLVVSVDRLDYTKGFEERLDAIERLLERKWATRSRTAFLQVGAPTRRSIPRYEELAARVRSRVHRINQRFGDAPRKPVIFVERYTEPAELFRYYRAADVCYVGSLDDGMNLVAKEFVAARDDEHGALLLSRFAGASRELTEALLVNPFDIDGVADALGAALAMCPAEQQTRMQHMRAWVAEHNVYRWAGEMLADAVRVRPHRFAGRLDERLAAARIMWAPQPESHGI